MLCGDGISRASSPIEALRVLASALRPELLVAIGVFVDMARAPDCDIACRGTALGYLLHLPLKPFLRTHRGWYHSPWAALYASTAASALLAAAALLANSAAAHLGFGPSLPLSGITAAAFSAALLSYLLHLVEDSVTIRGVRWLGVRVRGPLRTGETDLLATALVILASTVLATLAYLAVGSLSSAALVGILTVVACFALIARVGRSS